MNRIPFPVSAQPKAQPEPDAKTEYEPYYTAPQPRQAAKPEVELTALELMYAYYDAA